MASITITFDHPQLALTRTFNITNAELARIAVACRNKFSRPEAPLDNAGTVQKITDIWWGQLRQITRAYELEQAQLALTVPPIDPT